MALIRQIALPLATVAIALALFGCGSSGGGSDITGEKFSSGNELDFNTNLDKIGALVISGDCTGATDKLNTLIGAVEELPSSVDEGLKTQLVDLLSQLGGQIDQQCKPADTTASTTTTESSTTSPTTTDTTSSSTTDSTKSTTSSSTTSTNTTPPPDNPGNTPPVAPPAGGGGGGGGPTGGVSPGQSGGFGPGKATGEKKPKDQKKPKHGKPGKKPKHEKPKDEKR